MSQTFVPTADPLPPVAEISILLPLGVIVIFEPAVMLRVPVNELSDSTPLVAVDANVTVPEPLSVILMFVPATRFNSV